MGDVIFLIRRDTAASFTAGNPVLAAGEQGYETDTRLMKVGDGSTAWNSLLYQNVAGQDLLEVYNNTGVTLNPGEIVYVSGYNVGASLPEVDLADADDPAKMPAVGMVETAISNGARGPIIDFGTVSGVNTAGMSVNDAIYVSTTAGAFTNTRPVVDQIQKIGEVLQVGASGKVLIVGAGRANDVPIAPSFTDFTNANHDHSNAAGGGTLAAAAVPDGADATAIHDNVAGEIVLVTEKVSPVGADVILIEDSAAANAKKRVQISNLPAGGEINDLATDGVAGIADDQIVVGSGAGTAAYKTLPTGAVGYTASTNTVAQAALADLSDVSGTTGTGSTVVKDTSPTIVTPTVASFANAGHNHQDAAGGGTLASAATPTGIHDDVAGEIAAITEKVSPVGADVILIEDSAAANAKKRVQISNLPAGGEINDLAVDGVNGIADDQIVVGSGASTAAYKTLPNGAVSYATATNTVSQAALADLSDVTAKTGSGTTVVMDTSPTIVTPTIASFANAGHNHQDAAGGGTLASAATPTAIHDDVASEISAITLKATPVSGDFLLIEDSAAANVKKRVTVGSLPAGSEANNLAADGVAGIADDQIVVGSGAGTAAYHTLPTGAVGYTASTNTVAQAALADLSDVTAKTGSGTTVVMDTSPTIVTPTIASFANAGHNHQDAAGGGTLAHNSATDNPTVAHGATGAVVGTTNTQTLTNKTLTAPTVDGAGGLTLDTGAGTNAVATEVGLDKSSASAETFNVQNSGAGAMTLQQDGVAVVTETGTQTLTNKTLTTPTIGDFTNSTHNHTNAAGGGTLAIATATTGDLARSRQGEYQRGITIEDPVVTDDFMIFRTNVAITITEMDITTRGSSTPSVTVDIRHGTDRSAAGSALITTPTASTEVANNAESTGHNITSFNDATIVADSVVWIEFDAVSGTVDEVHVELYYTVD